MAEQGLESLVPLADLAVIGRCRGAAARAGDPAPRARDGGGDPRRAARCGRDDRQLRVQLARRARLRRSGETLPLIHYVAPMVWAWRAGRARRMARWYDHLLTLLPFEPPYFERVGLACSYVGHPVLESGADRGDAARFRAAHGIAADDLLLDRAARQPRRRGAPAAADFRRGAAPAGGIGRAVSRRRADGGERRRRRWPQAAARLAGRADRACAATRRNTTPSPPAARRLPRRDRWRWNWRWRGCRWSSPIASTR